jgi:hypothetical protein
MKGDSSVDIGFAKLFNLGTVSFKVVQHADAWVVGYSAEPIASFIVGLDLKITLVSLI